MRARYPNVALAVVFCLGCSTLRARGQGAGVQTGSQQGSGPTASQFLASLAADAKARAEGRERATEEEKRALERLKWAYDLYKKLPPGVQTAVAKLPGAIDALGSGDPLAAAETLGRGLDEVEKFRATPTGQEYGETIDRWVENEWQEFQAKRKKERLARWQSAIESQINTLKDYAEDKAEECAALREDFDAVESQLKAHRWLRIKDSDEFIREQVGESAKADYERLQERRSAIALEHRRLKSLAMKAQARAGQLRNHWPKVPGIEFALGAFEMANVPHDPVAVHSFQFSDTAAALFSPEMSEFLDAWDYFQDALITTYGTIVSESGLDPAAAEKVVAIAEKAKAEREALGALVRRWDTEAEYLQSAPRKVPVPSGAVDPAGLSDNGVLRKYLNSPAFTDLAKARMTRTFAALVENVMATRTGLGEAIRACGGHPAQVTLNQGATMANTLLAPTKKLIDTFKRSPYGELRFVSDGLMPRFEILYVHGGLGHSSFTGSDVGVRVEVRGSLSPLRVRVESPSGSVSARPSSVADPLQVQRVMFDLKFVSEGKSEFFVVAEADCATGLARDRIKMGAEGLKRPETDDAAEAFFSKATKVSPARARQLRKAFDPRRRDGDDLTPAEEERGFIASLGLRPATPGAITAGDRLTFKALGQFGDDAKRVDLTSDASLKWGAWCLAKGVTSTMQGSTFVAETPGRYVVSASFSENGESRRVEVPLVVLAAGAGR